MTLFTGIFYPVVITGLAQLLFPQKANGGMIVRDGILIGSELIGQQFNSPKYFWGRLSATSSYPYNAGASSGSNLGPLNPELKEAVESRMKELRAADPHNKQPIPIDLVTASSSGLDPHISVAAAIYQAGRIAKHRGIEKQKVLFLINQNAQRRTFDILGETRVNVLKLNLALDEIQQKDIK